MLRPLPFLLTALALAPAAAATCPASDVLAGEVRRLPFHLASRAAEFDTVLPEGLVPRALEKPGRVEVERDGKKGHAVVVTPLPVEALWKAINDEDRYSEHFGLILSRVTGGTPRGADRLVFQAVKRLGVGRWWFIRNRLSADLYRASGGRLWELIWRDADGEPDLSRPPISTVVEDLREVEFTRGAWLFARLGPECTLVEYFVWSDPGGFISAVQALGAKGAILDTVEGLLRFARIKHEGDPGEGDPPFLRPDGTPLP